MKCDYCKEEIQGMPFRCRRCYGHFCSRHRLPENHECVGLIKGNIFLNLKKENVSEEERKEEKQEIHFFVSRVFNRIFNDYIAKHSKKKPVGLMKGGTKDFYYYDVEEKYYIARDLELLRDSLLKEKRINKTLLKKIIDKLIIILKESNYDKELRNLINAYLEEIDNNYNIDLFNYYTYHLKKEQKKDYYSVNPKYKKEYIDTSKLSQESYDHKPYEYQSSKSYSNNENSNLRKNYNKKNNKKRTLLLFIFLVLFFLGSLYFYQSKILIFFNKDISNITSFNLNIPFKNSCNDSTPYNQCSSMKPYFCENGSLIEKPELCGCPENKKIVKYVKGYFINIKGEKEEIILPQGTNSYAGAKFHPEKEILICEEKKKCSDGTYYGECSQEKPYFCFEGKLINKSSYCGCPKGTVSYKEQCIPAEEINPIKKNFSYVLDGNKGYLTFTLYGGLKDYLQKLPRSISYSLGEQPPTTKDFVMKYLNNKKQKIYLMPLVNQIRNITNNKDNQARIAISLVQHIPYDWDGFINNSDYIRYPYEVLFDNNGVCGEKSKLLAFLLRELGYGVALFNYEMENHMAVGIKCPLKYSYRNTGYCFIETTSPSIITYANSNYVNVGKLTSNPEIILVSEGDSFDSVSKEYYDAQVWENLQRKAEANNNVLSRRDYKKWKELVKKYDIKIET